MNYQVVVEADTNDADYITQITEFKREELDMGLLQIICNTIVANNSNWHTGEQGDAYKDYEGLLSKENIDWFSGFCPYGEHGIHSIESVEVTEIGNKVKLI